MLARAFGLPLRRASANVTFAGPDESWWPPAAGLSDAFFFEPPCQSAATVHHRLQLDTDQLGALQVFEDPVAPRSWTNVIRVDRTSSQSGSPLAPLLGDVQDRPCKSCHAVAGGRARACLRLGELHPADITTPNSVNGPHGRRPTANRSIFDLIPGASRPRSAAAGRSIEQGPISGTSVNQTRPAFTGIRAPNRPPRAARLRLRIDRNRPAASSCSGIFAAAD